MDREILSTNRKTLRINLNQEIYGSFAEIGGGQEVARCFFQAGGASGTVAKTISAYDKSFSDVLYNEGKSGRYVSEQRLVKMLNTEYNETIRLLKDRRKKETCFFAFANTVETLNYAKSNQGHGWIGFKFQLKGEHEPNTVILHVNLSDNDVLLQQQVLGVLGVNLIFACYHYHDKPNTFLLSLFDNLDPDRLEITMVRMSGPELDYVDNRLLGVQLVKNGMTNAIIFDREGNVQQPADMLYKKNVLAFRGSFRPVTYVTVDMLQTSFRIFKRDEDYDKSNTISVCEMTLNNLLQKGELDERDFLDRVDLLNGMGQNVMVSNFREYYKLVSYFSQFTFIKLRVVIGVPTFMNLLEKKYYDHLKGGLFEALGKTFIDKMKLYVYPTYSSVSIEDHTQGGEFLTSKNILMEDDMHGIYNYLLKNKKIIDIAGAKPQWLYINPRNVLKMIQENKPGWEYMVPNYIEEQIKKKKLFGYFGDEGLSKDKSTNCSTSPSKQ